jgi:hypothetical protein
MVNRRQEPQGKMHVEHCRRLHVARSPQLHAHVGRESNLARMKRLVLALHLRQHAGKWRQLRGRAGRSGERKAVHQQRGLSQSQGGVESRQHRGRDGLPLKRKRRKLHKFGRSTTLVPRPTRRKCTCWIAGRHAGVPEFSPPYAIAI